MNIGERIRDIRTKRNLTQDEFGEILQMGRTNIANYENNRIVPPTEVMIKIATAFKVSLDYLAGITSTTNETYKEESNLTPEQEVLLKDHLEKMERKMRELSGLNEEMLTEAMENFDFIFRKNLKKTNNN